MVIKNKKDNKGFKKCSQNKKRKTIFESESNFYQ